MDVHKKEYTKSCFYRQWKNQATRAYDQPCPEASFRQFLVQNLPSYCFFQGGRKDEDPQASIAQHSITLPEAGLPARPEHLRHVAPSLLLCSLSLIPLVFSFLLLVHTQTCLYKPVAGGHYPKGNLGSQTHNCASELLCMYSLLQRQ